MAVTLKGRIMTITGKDYTLVAEYARKRKKGIRFIVLQLLNQYIKTYCKTK